MRSKQERNSSTALSRRAVMRNAATIAATAGLASGASAQNGVVGKTNLRFVQPDTIFKTATYTHAYARSNGFLTLLSDGTRLTGSYGLGPEAGEWMQQATLAIRARVPLPVLVDTMQPFPSFSGIFDSALKELSMAVAGMPPPARPMAAQMSNAST